MNWWMVLALSAIAWATDEPTFALGKFGIAPTRLTGVVTFVRAVLALPGVMP